MGNPAGVCPCPLLSLCGTSPREGRPAYKAAKAKIKETDLASLSFIHFRDSGAFATNHHQTLRKESQYLFCKALIVKCNP
jgi:hypothetical protein